jgi:signal peptide peptidase-like protein 2B
MLLALFYFAHQVLYVLQYCLVLSSIPAVAFVLWDWFCLLVPPWLSVWTTFAAASVIVLVWFATEHWMVSNLIAFCSCAIAVCVIKVHRLQMVLVISFGFIVYDVWWVFLSPILFGKSVMTEAALSAGPHIPAIFIVPRDDGASMLGLGDVLLPGVVLDFFMRFDASHGTSLFVIAFIGYCVGVQISWIAVFLMERGQPALLWVLPAILVPVLIASTAQGLLGELWKVGTVGPDEDVEGDAKSGQDHLVIESSSDDNDAKENAPQKEKENGKEQENAQTREPDAS